MERSFNEGVYEIVAKIPRGSVISYGQIARLLERPRAARIVGWAMSRCPEHLDWQRVVMADGTIAGGEFEALRRARLQDDGVLFLPDGRVDMEKCFWNGVEALA